MANQIDPAALQFLGAPSPSSSCSTATDRSPPYRPPGAPAAAAILRRHCLLAHEISCRSSALRSEILLTNSRT
ncbi:hypothetical protein U9M48_001906 [Paspalum notatum var. saurae]|uniref:Uncharacterized protein n=1 Tax=Paspalum notatum var. saurae TaxID=547442 RepID=A0AAQ3PQB6_PASNO